MGQPTNKTRQSITIKKRQSSQSKAKENKARKGRGEKKKSTGRARHTFAVVHYDLLHMTT